MVVRNTLLLLVLFQGLLQGRLSLRWNFPSSIVGLTGSCVEIPCTYHPYKDSRTPAIVWHIYPSATTYLIFDSQGSSSVLPSYKHRTSLIPGNYSCTLRIDPVTREDQTAYMPGMAEMLWDDFFPERGRYLRLRVRDSPEKPELRVPDGAGLIDNGLPAAFTCSVVHTCGSTPPVLKWNKPGQTQRQYEDLFQGYWREISSLRYIPSHKDDNTEIKCTATYPNGRIAEKGEMLRIQYAPKNVMVSLSGGRDLTEGSNIILTCSCDSNPPPQRYEWYTGERKRNLQLQKYRIAIENVSRDSGPITCAAINDVGKGESSPMEIPVQYAATGVEVIILPPTEGATKLKCSFRSSRPEVTHYTWIKNGKYLLNDIEQILTLERSENNSATYACIAHNTAGSSTSAELIFEDHKSVDNFHGKLGTKNIIYVILFPVLGFICLLTLTLLVYLYRRTKARQISPRSENSQCPDTTYMDLVKTEISHNYDIIKPHPAAGPRDLTLDNCYENLHLK